MGNHPTVRHSDISTWRELLSVIAAHPACNPKVLVLDTLRVCITLCIRHCPSDSMPLSDIFKCPMFVMDRDQRFPKVLIWTEIFKSQVIRSYWVHQWCSPSDYKRPVCFDAFVICAVLSQFPNMRKCNNDNTKIVIKFESLTSKSRSNLHHDNIVIISSIPDIKTHPKS